MSDDAFTLLNEDNEVILTESGPVTKDGLGDLFAGDLPVEDLSEDEIEERVANSMDPDLPDPGWDSMTTQLIKASCAFTAQELLRGPPEPPYNGKFLIGDHHIEWDELISKHKRLCILASRNHGKCAAGDTPILKADGTTVRIDEWKGGDLIAWDEESGLFRKSYAPSAVSNGEKPVIKITLESGRSLTLTMEHPLWTDSGWVSATDIKVGHSVAVTNGLIEQIKKHEEWLEFDAPIIWDSVVSTEDMPPVETWDLRVPGYHTFIANDIINHNTFFVDFAYPIWQIINNPRKSGFIFSSTQDQAERILGDIKDEIETNPKLQWLVPKVKDKWGSRLIRCSNGCRLYARGFGTKVRGAHPFFIVVDDGLTDETQYSEMVRRKQKDYFYAAITNMINPGGQIIVIGTPLSSDDLYSDLKENPEYHYAEYPAESNPGHPDNKALWADRFSLEDLARIRREIGEIMYTREFLCSPISDSMSLFPLKLFRGQDVERFNLKLGMPLEFWQQAGITIYMGVDFAISSNVGADYTVVFVLGSDKYGNRWIVDIHRAKGMPYQEQLSLINTVARKYDPVSVFLESNQMQRIFGDELIRTSDLPIHKFNTGVQKHSLDKGVPSLRVLLENGKFRIPRGDAHSIEMTDIWIKEMNSFTYIDGKLTSVGGHDDTAMACYICDQAVKTGGFAFSFGDEEDYKEKDMDKIMKELTGDTERSDDDTEDEATIAAKKNPAIQQGYVPHDCTMDFVHIMSHIGDGNDPCNGCHEDRKICKGRGSSASLV